MAKDDPWKHRSERMLCKTCMFYVEKVTRTAVVEGIPKVGRCRRNAPTIKGYPVVYDNDWCGEHKLDEDKI